MAKVVGVEVEGVVGVEVEVEGVVEVEGEVVGGVEVEVEGEVVGGVMFSRGDLVRVISDHPYHGEVTSVIGMVRGYDRRLGDVDAYMVDLPPCRAVGERGYACFLPEHLEKVDDYDGNEKTTWDECVWRPRELVSLHPLPKTKNLGLECSILTLSHV